MKKQIVAHWWKLILDPSDRFYVTKKGEKYLRREKKKDLKRKAVIKK